MQNTDYLLALHSINGLGPIRLKAMLDYFGDPKKAWEAGRDELVEIGIYKSTVDLLVESRKTLNPEKYTQEIKKAGIKWVTIFDAHYPNLLKEIYDPPVVLYYKGEIKADEGRVIAVVGTRKITGYGKMVTEKFTQELVSYGFTIVSGLARGVDSHAHWATVYAGGRTIAVLGGGLNNIFPPENTRLAEKIVETGGAVVSEFPPSAPSLPGNFPARNRIISGMSLAILVTEAAFDSGSLITAKDALEQGRDVFAIPGPITSDLSKGPLSLIKQGARLVTESGEILEELGMESKAPSTNNQLPNNHELSEIEQKIVDCLAGESKHVDELCRELDFTAALVSSSLIKMEIYGLVKHLGGGNYVKVI